MTIIIDKRYFSLRLTYDIRVNGVHEFIAKSDIFHLPYKPQLSIYDLSENKILYFKLASPILFEYDFFLPNEEGFEIRIDENTENIYSFYYKAHKHTIHFNSDDSASIFRHNEKVVDFMKEQKFEDYIITCYNDSYKLIAMAIVLAYDFSIQKKPFSYY